MKRMSLVVLTTGAVLATAITGTALAVGNQSTVPTGSGSSPTAAVSPAAVPPPAASASGSADASPTDRAAVSQERAVKIALARVGGGKLAKAEQEVEHGRTEWKVEILKNGVRYGMYIDQATGRIARAEQKPAGAGHIVGGTPGVTEDKPAHHTTTEDNPARHTTPDDNPTYHTTTEDNPARHTTPDDNPTYHTTTEDNPARHTTPDDNPTHHRGRNR